MSDRSPEQLRRATEQTVAEGRAQAARLRRLGVKRQPASPRIVVPDPTPGQLAFLERKRRRGLHVAGISTTSGTMIVEIRVYAKAAPTERIAVSPAGRATMSMWREYGYSGYRGGTWIVVRGERGKTLARGVRGYDAALMITGRKKPEEAS